ncbi:hypothetical protein ACG83_29395 [Frankia sp. R43]|uniref:PucR family transcriptional regulator n=1 Tax=Frankia sp. R43 TaxID=269536 RepID=UPI0006CA2638|nr:PucR family transcriptional regulator [Frankia sp. R43]KPM52463.1 hypothetical protein ACG83_29395 [Frankia sp. R43]
MTDTKSARIYFGGVPVDRHLSVRIRELAASVVTELSAQLSAYASLPEEELRGDITQTTRTCIRLFTHMLRTGEPPAHGQLRELRESAGQRADEGVPLEALIDAYHLGAEVCVDRVIATVEPGDLPAILTVQRLLLRYLRTIISEVSAGYLEARLAAIHEEQDARRAMLSALLTASPAEIAARRAAVRLPASYAVISLEIAPHPDELNPAVDALVAARRKLRRIRTELEGGAPAVVLHGLSPDGGLVLVPLDDAVGARPTENLAERSWGALSSLVGQLGRAARAEITGGVVPARPDAVAPAARLATEICQIARVSGRPAGIYQLGDVAFDYQLTRPGPARDYLASRLQPLANRPDLLETLRVFLACGLDRRRAAGRLHVHPNTVDYRVRKASALTGLDPTSSGDLPMIHAAFTAHAADAGGLN